MEIVGQHDDSWLVMLIRQRVIIIAVWSTYVKLPHWETEERLGMSGEKMDINAMATRSPTY